MNSRSSIKCSCGYEWVPRVEAPKACPECKRRLRKDGRFNGDGASGDLRQVPAKTGSVQFPTHASSSSEIQMPRNGKPMASPTPGTPRFRAMVKYAEQYKRNPSEEELDVFEKKGW